NCATSLSGPAADDPPATPSPASAGRRRTHPREGRGELRDEPLRSRGRRSARHPFPGERRTYADSPP
ncbi:hypothetical protein, partial [Streptomyces turgidiscabies]|uniref:hypothetical protein n=1 Tax=Streptomyces turgidiscabies TaxID=85558 RepID=UPI0038F7C7BE